MSLFLSPDQQFLTRELFDTNENPWELRQREARDLESALENGKFPTKGLPDAPVIVTIFSDFQCPYCRQQAIIFSQFTDPDIRIIFRNLPLSSHSWARPAAEMTTCLYQQSNEAFWQVHDSLFLAQQSLSSIEYLIAFLERALSTTAGVDMSEYKECVSKKEMSEHVDRDIAFAVENGITSTPTLFVNGIRVEGVTSIEGMRKILESTSQNQTIGQP